MSSLLAVCLKRIHATTVPLRLDAAGHALRAEEAPAAANPADLAALALALRLREAAGAATRVLALTVGPPDWEEPLRAALAAGADETVRLWNVAWPRERWSGALDGSASHTQLCAQAAAEALRPLAPVLVLAGEASADAAHGCFGAFLAQALDAGFAHRATALSREGEGWRARVKLERGYTEELDIAAPAVVTVAPGGAAPPYAGLPAWMASRTAAIPTEAPALPYPTAPNTTLRAPVPRVKRYTVPDAALDAEARIRAMVDQPVSGGGALLDAAQGPAAQAEAVVKLLRERGYVGKV